MDPFNFFQRRMLVNYIWGSAVAVCGVGSLFIFYTLQLEMKEMMYLIFVMLVSVGVMLTAEIMMYKRHVRPIQQLFAIGSPAPEQVKSALLRAHQFPQLTVKRILGPHLLGLSIPASLLAWGAIERGLVDLPLYYIGYAWMGAVLIAVMHALIEFFMTDRAVQLLLPSIYERGALIDYKRETSISIKTKLFLSSMFTAVFPVVLFLLASQVRLSEGDGVDGYWNWASIIALVVMGIGALAALLLYRSIQEPMEHLSERFLDVRRGEMNSMDNLYIDEFAELVSGFNHMVTGIKERDKENERLLESFFTVFAATLDARDPYTAGHSKRVAEYSDLIARRAGFDERHLDLLKKSALLHDIGKIGIRDDVLLKEGRLSEGEFAKIKEHPVIGAQILLQVQLPESLTPVLAGVRHHHERYDGKGYPDGLAGDEIPLFGRLMAVADAFDAMTSDRPYRQGMPVSQALAIIEEGKGTQWDPYFAELLLVEMRQDLRKKALG
ncbi:HD domain-containing protein [Halobacillus litoralis]|uniref:HD domain-containing protein n=1 Tax=Halobacillus litoralis TaxID=45668 RepID=A0A845FGM0_9BACI|nr:HD domain-containing phosphohydrolase [Halobacillus litoralis]MYL73130.1 HD domain-containing protein [Halobacillus litoralis]